MDKTQGDHRNDNKEKDDNCIMDRSEEFALLVVFLRYYLILTLIMLR